MSVEVTLATVLFMVEQQVGGQTSGLLASTWQLEVHQLSVTTKAHPSTAKNSASSDVSASETVMAEVARVSFIVQQSSGHTEGSCVHEEVHHSLE